MVVGRSVQLDVQLGNEDGTPEGVELEWEVDYIVTQPVRDYALAFQLVDDFIGRSAGMQLTDAKKLREELLDGRRDYHEDKLNQARNDMIEKVDDAITEVINDQGIDAPDAPINTETPGSAIDRLCRSIVSEYMY